MEAETNKNRLKVALTLMSGFVIMIILIVIVGVRSNLFSDNYQIRIFSENVEGLTVNSPVMLGGMKIGSVRQMDFVNSKRRTGIIITLLLQSKYQPLITINSTATIKTLGILGDKFIDINIGGQGEKPLSEDSYISLDTTPGMGNIAQKLNVTLDNLNSIFADVKQMTDTINSGNGTIGKLIYNSKTLDKIDMLIASAANITETLNSGKGSLGKLLYQDSLYNSIDLLSSNLAHITGELKQGKGNAGKLIYDDSLYTNVNKLLSKVSYLLEKTNSNGNTAGRIMNDDELYKQLINTIGNANRLISNINEDPKKYLKFSLF